MRNTLIFPMVTWIAEIALILLYQQCNGFVPMEQHASLTTISFSSPLHKWHPRQASRRYDLTAASSTLDLSDAGNGPISSFSENDAAMCSTKSTTFSLEMPLPKKSRRRRAWNFLKKKIRFWRKHSGEGDINPTSPTSTLEFSYDYDVIDLPSGNNAPVGTTGILLIHPIGVGIARWYYQRLVSSLIAKQPQFGKRFVVVVPDLLGSGSACNATISATEHPEPRVATKFPLFNISDWTDQVDSLISSIEADKAESESKIDKWCVVANGGCSPIALQLAERKKVVLTNEASSAVPVTNLILSSVPRLPFFLKNETTNDPAKVAKSYQTLSGIPGNLFWWYSCRNDGAFIQTFSEKNLIADPKNLGPNWRSNCYRTAVSFEGRGRYATFSFLAGTLQDGCLPSLVAVKNTSLAIDIIKGVDVRRNRARSWFWQKPEPPNTSEEPRESQPSDSTAVTGEGVGSDVAADARNSEDAPGSSKSYETFRDYAEKNGNGGRELVIGGRISLAHEDPEGYADAILQFLSE